MFIAIIVWVAVVMATNGITVKVAYYEVAAQIPPRPLPRPGGRAAATRESPPGDTKSCDAAYAMALGEYYALRVISDPGTNGESTFSIVTAGLAVAAIAVVLPALVEDPTPNSDDGD